LSKSATSRDIGLPLALGLTLIAGVIGLPTTRFEFPTVAASLASIAWKIGTAFVMVVGCWLIQSRRPTARDVGLLPIASNPIRERTPVAIPAVIGLTLIAMFWSQIPVLKNLSAAGAGTSYDAVPLTTGVLVLELAVRYPITVVIEESFFRGFLQPRIGLAAPVVIGVLFAIYHLQQYETIPSLVPFGIALGVLRWWLGSIWPGAVFHYAGNAMFILSLR
jgi:membrane protease YdiL (CAAX protease family)